MSSLTYCLVVTGPHYGTEQASSAYLFANALLEKGHQIAQIFFYREGVVNANRLVLPANDEFDLPKAWITLAKRHQIPLHVCVAAALRRGIIDADIRITWSLPGESGERHSVTKPSPQYLH